MTTVNINKDILLSGTEFIGKFTGCPDKSECFMNRVLYFKYIHGFMYFHEDLTIENALYGHTNIVSEEELVIDGNRLTFKTKSNSRYTVVVEQLSSERTFDALFAVTGHF